MINMRQLLFTIFLMSGIWCQAQKDSTIYYVYDSLMFKVSNYTGRSVYFSDGKIGWVCDGKNMGQVMYSTKCEKHYRDGKLYFCNVYEGRFEFAFVLENSKWLLVWTGITNCTAADNQALSIRCRGLTTSFARCKNKATNNGYCSTHD